MGPGLSPSRCSAGLGRRCWRVSGGSTRLPWLPPSQPPLAVLPTTAERPPTLDAGERCASFMHAKLCLGEGGGGASGLRIGRPQHNPLRRPFCAAAPLERVFYGSLPLPPGFTPGHEGDKPGRCGVKPTTPARPATQPVAFQARSGPVGQLCARRAPCRISVGAHPCGVRRGRRGEERSLMVDVRAGRGTRLLPRRKSYS